MELSKIVRPFYDTCLTVTAGGDPSHVASVLDALLADDFRSINSAETKSKQQLIGQVQFFWKIVPDLAWRIDEMLEVGSRVVVRSTATGSPRGEFMGIPVDGSRTFRVMTIDIHTVIEGRIREVHHVEEWATAMRQLRG
jgi:predicted ester cyclase